LPHQRHFDINRLKKKIMRIKASYFGVAVAMGSLSAVPHTSAQVFLGNMPAANDAGTPSLLTDVRFKAVGFTTPAGLPYNIDSVTVRLNNYTAADNPFVGFYTDAGGEPSNDTGNPTVGLVGSWLTDAAPNAGTAGNFTFVPAGTITLAANTTYWLVVGGEAAGTSFNWLNSNPSVAPTSTEGTTFVGYRGMVPNDPDPPVWAVSAFFNPMEIQATPVPEPQHYALAAGLGLMGFGVLRRYRSKAA
jgi:hypothetical protein